MRSIAIISGLLVFGGMMQQAQASVIGLNDWCVNFNGNISAACNGAGAGNGSISLAAYDKTLEGSGANNLGSVTVTLAPGLNQYVNFYADYDVDYTTFLSFDDFGSSQGSVPAGLHYSIDDPNVSNIFTDFQNNTLANVNNVGTPAGPPNNCCDVSLALGLGGLNVLAGGSGTVTFTVSKVAPASGFYLRQTNQDTSDAIYLQGVASISNPGGTTTPEPATEFLAFSAVCGGLIWKRFRPGSAQRRS